MQETGNSLGDKSFSTEMLSIWLAPGGLSFCAGKIINGSLQPQTCLFGGGVSMADGVSKALAEFPALAQSYSRVEVILDTEKVVYVPDELFEPSLMESYLALHSFSMADSVAVGSAPVCGMRAVMLVCRDVAERVASQYSHCQVDYYSPLQENVARRHRNAIEILLTPQVAYITVADEVLRTVEAVTIDSPADLLYCVKKVYSQPHPIYIGGHNAAEAVKLLRRYYPQVEQQRRTYNFITDENNQR